METFLGIDYPTLWYLVVGLLFSGYAILEGFDYGAGAWHLFLRKDESHQCWHLTLQVFFTSHNLI